ncbi:putative ribonuclease H-like domain-containing protein [Tanacetum coccineum]
MNQFYGMKGIKREFSVARTPQQNGVAERKNRTLIEAARTMLADSLLPTTFWAEAFSTACYVQNRVLVTKPHNKTPYELLHGSGPEWLFDIDLLTNSMNYEPVNAGNQTNNNASIKDNVDAVPTHQYIMLPLLYDSPQSSKDAVADDAGKKTNEEPTNKDKRNGQEKEGGASNKENEQNYFSPSVSTVGQNFTNIDDLHTDPLILDLEDTGIFNGAYNDEDVGAEADLNNLETTMNVSPIPITRIHKDHPINQIIGDINSATQTRRMTKITKNMVSIKIKDPNLQVMIGKTVDEGFTEQGYRSKQEVVVKEFEEQDLLVRIRTKKPTHEETVQKQPGIFLVLFSHRKNSKNADKDKQIGGWGAKISLIEEAEYEVAIK